MTRTGRKGNHRSKKKRIVIAMAPLVAIAVAIPLMNQAGAATPSEVTKDCAENSDKLDNCEFVDVQVRNNSLGPNQSVSTVTAKCGSTRALSKSISVSA